MSFSVSLSFKRMFCDDDDSMVLKVRKEKMRKIESVRRCERLMSKAVLHYLSDRFAMTTMMITK